MTKVLAPMMLAAAVLFSGSASATPATRVQATAKTPNAAVKAVLGRQFPGMKFNQPALAQAGLPRDLTFHVTSKIDKLNKAMPITLTGTVIGDGPAWRATLDDQR